MFGLSTCSTAVSSTDHQSKFGKRIINHSKKHIDWSKDNKE